MTDEVITNEEWKRCKDGALMLSLLEKVSGPPGSDGRRPLVLAACECARLALPHIQKGESRPLFAIETAERWAHGGKVTLEQMQTAADAATHAAYDASYNAAHAAACAAAPNDTAYAATYAARADDAPERVLCECADIVRKHFPEPPVKAGK